jgi:hypothetical protein
MIVIRLAVALLVLVALALVAVRAEAPPAEAAPGRYTFKEVPDGVLRLDTGSGQVSLCGRRHGAWTCETIADDRAALEAEIGRLQGETGALRRELLAHGLRLPDGVRGDAPGGKAQGENPALPSDADLDRVMTFVGKLWHRFLDMMQNMQKSLESGHDSNRTSIRTGA